jgi:WD40 repeat protein
VQHAHQKAVLHRDLKPSNILVAEVDGQPLVKVIDFGVAKALGQDGEESWQGTLARTLDGMVVGTPQYMSPEQAGAAVDIDTRSDVYTLGVILYELLCGETPLTREQLKHAAFDEMLRLIRESETRRPSSRLFPVSADAQTHAIARNTEAKKLSTTLRGDLDWIMLKALEKERDRRYGSAAALAADLHRHLKNEPVEAGPPDALYRLRKLVGRNRVAFGSAAAVLLALCLGLVAALWQATIASQAKNAAERDRDAKDLALQEVNRASEAEKVQRERADAALKETAQVNKDQQDLLRDVSRGDLSGAAKLVEDGQSAAALAHIRRALKLDPANAAAASFLTTLLSYSSSPLPPVPVSVVLSPYKNQISAISGDGRKAVSKGYSQAEIWDTMQGKRIGAVIDHAEYMEIVRFDAAGKLLVTTSNDKSTRIWNATTGQPASQPLVHPAPVSAAAFAPNGKRLLTVCDDQCVRLWDSPNGKQVGDVLRHDSKVVWADFGPDQDVCITVSAGENDSVFRWDLRGGSVMRHQLASLPGRQNKLACSANGCRLAIVNAAGEAKIFDLTQPESTLLEINIGGRPGELVFHPSGRWLATSSDRTVAVWDCSTGARISSTIVAPGEVTGLALSEDGRRIAVVSGDLALTATLTIWQVSTGKAATHPHPVGSVNRGSDGLRFADGDRSIFLAGRNDITKLRLAASNTVPLSTNMRGASRIRAFSPRRNWLAAAEGQRLIFRSRASDPSSESDALFRTPITGMTASPQGRFLAVQTGEREMVAWETGQKKADSRLVAPGAITCAAFSGDERWLACGGEFAEGGWVCVWDLNENSALRGGVARLQPKLQINYPAPVVVVGVNQDGKHLVAGVASTELRFLSGFDINGQRELGKMDFGAAARSLVFSPLGNRVACTTVAGATVWDYMANQGCWINPPASATSIVGSLTFSSDGKRLFTAGYDAMVNEWDVSGPLVSDLLPVPKTLRHRTHVNLVSNSQDGEWLFTAASYWGDPINETRLWHAPTQLPASVAFPATLDSLNESSLSSPWFGVTEGDGGTWMLAGDKLWESFQGLPCGTGLPTWIPDLISYAGGVDLGGLGELQPIPAALRLAALARLRIAVKQGHEDDPWIAFLGWYLADPTERTLSPHGRQSLHDAFIEASADRNLGRLADLYRLDPQNPLTHLAEARAEKSKDTAAFLRALAVTRLITRDPSGRHLNVDAKTALHAGEQLLSQDDAAGAWVIASGEQLAAHSDGAGSSKALRAAALVKTGKQQEALVTLQLDSASSGELGEFVRLLFTGTALMSASDQDALFRSLWQDIWPQASEVLSMQQADFEQRYDKLKLGETLELRYRGEGRWRAVDGDRGIGELFCLGPDIVDARSGILLAEITGDSPSSNVASRAGKTQFFISDTAAAHFMKRTWNNGFWSPWQEISQDSLKPLSKPSSSRNP